MLTKFYHLLVWVVLGKLGLPQAASLLRLQLQGLEQTVVRPQGRHGHALGLALAQGLADNVLKLNVVALLNVLAHAGLEGGVGGVAADEGVGQVVGQVDAVGLGGGLDLEHDGADEVVDDVAAHAHAGRVETQDGGGGVVAGVVEQLAPARLEHVGLVDDVELAAAVVDVAVALGGRLGHVARHARVVKGANLLRVGVVVHNVAVALFRRPNHRDAADDGVGREPRDDGLLDVEAVLRQHNGRLARRDGRLDQVGHRGGDVDDVFGRDEHVVKGGEVLLGYVGDGFSD